MEECISLDFHQVGTDPGEQSWSQIGVTARFSQHKRNFENETKGFCYIVDQTRILFEIPDSEHQNELNFYPLKFLDRNTLVKKKMPNFCILNS